MLVLMAKETILMASKNNLFPRIIYDKIEKIRGFDINFVTSAKTDDEARKLLKFMGMPFKA